MNLGLKTQLPKCCLFTVESQSFLKKGSFSQPLLFLVLKQYFDKEADICLILLQCLH